MINLEKLNQIEERFEFLEAKLTQQLRADEIRDIGLEYSELKIIVEKIQTFKKITMELEEVESALDDPELRVLALDEKKYLSEELSNVRNELITELIPKDEADIKPAILEIRAGTGGDEDVCNSGVGSGSASVCSNWLVTTSVLSYLFSTSPPFGLRKITAPTPNNSRAIP